jgi:large subunit ribosomal protein L9
MKVILTAEVKGKGHEGDVVDVARGYAVNYLLPRNMAIQATPGNLKQLGARMANITKRNESRRAEAEGLAGEIDGKTIVIEAKAGDEGKLFGSVTTLMIEEAIAAQLGTDVDHKRMDLHRPIKTLGDSTVTVTVYGDVKAEVVVRVVPEGGTTAAKAEPAVEAVAEEAVAEPVPEEVATEETVASGADTDDSAVAGDETAESDEPLEEGVE